jgi:hypothetical protein
MNRKAFLAIALVLVAQVSQAAGTSHILPFATSNTYVMSQTDYSAAGERTSGNVPGTRANSALVNKALRQCAAMSGVLAKFIADNTEFTVIDSPLALGTTVVAFEAALAAVSPTATPLATPSETRSGECPSGTPCSTKAVTPEGLKTLTSTGTRAGLIKTATNTGVTNDILTGTDDTKAVTPKGLVARQSSSTLTGLVELATDAETIAGTDTTRAVTPHGLDAALDDRFPAAASSLADPGYTTLPSGVILQWGSFNSTDSPAQTFPIDFPTSCLGVFLSVNDVTDAGVTSYDEDGFQPNIAAGGKTVRWFALGF